MSRPRLLSVPVSIALHALLLFVLMLALREREAPPLFVDLTRGWIAERDGGAAGGTAHARAGAADSAASAPAPPAPAASQPPRAAGARAPRAAARASGGAASEPPPPTRRAAPPPVDVPQSVPPPAVPVDPPAAAVRPEPAPAAQPAPGPVASAPSAPPAPAPGAAPAVPPADGHGGANGGDGSARGGLLLFPAGAGGGSGGGRGRGAGGAAGDGGGSGGVAGDPGSAGIGAGMGPGLQARAVPGEGQGGGGDYAPYLALVRQRIQQSLRYPAAARRRGLAGTVDVEIDVSPSGVIARAAVVGSSSHAILDDAALDAVRALPRVPFPPDLRPRALRARLPVVFELR